MTTSAAPAAPASSRTSWLLAAAIYVGLTLAYAWPLLSSIDRVLPHDIFDPGLNTWIIWWNSQAWPLTDAWWNAPIFYPATGAFAFSETFLSVTPLTTPLQWLGASAVVTYNITYLVSFPLTALATHALARQLTGRHDAGFIAGVALAFCPWRTAQMPHLQMLLMWWMPLTLFALHRYLDRRRPIDLVIAGVAWLMNGLTSGYFLVYFGVLIGFWALWFLRTRRDWILVPGTLIVASLPLVPLLMGYSRIQSMYGMSRGAGEVAAFSADLTAVWASAPDVVADLWTSNPAAEGELYPGLTVFLIALAGAAIAWRAQQSARWARARRLACIAAVVVGGVAAVLAIQGSWTTSPPGADIALSRPGKLFRAAVVLLIGLACWDRRLLGLWQRRSSQFFYAAAAIVMLLFALGPVARVFGSPFLNQTPYAWLMLLPGGDALRVPARFGVLFAMCLGQAAAIGFTRFSLGSATRLVAVVLTAAIYVEGWVPKFPVQAVPPTFDLEQMRPELPLLELPVSEHFSDSEAMLRATRHRHPLIHGTSGYAPSYYEGMVSGLQALDPVVIEALQAYGPFLVFVNQATDLKQRTRSFFDEYPGAAVIGRSQVGSLYELPRKLPVGPPDPSAGELPTASVEVSVHAKVIAGMRDRNVATRWDTGGPQLPGDQVTATFERPVVISHLELLLGTSAQDYPRGLRVSAATGSGPATTVWEGRTAGLALHALVKDPRNAPLLIPLPPGTQADRIVLTVTAGHPAFYWSIAELRIFGK